jgi:hypothetical protein
MAVVNPPDFNLASSYAPMFEAMAQRSKLELARPQSLDIATTAIKRIDEELTKQRDFRMKMAGEGRQLVSQEMADELASTMGKPVGTFNKAVGTYWSQKEFQDMVEYAEGLKKKKQYDEDSKKAINEFIKGLPEEEQKAWKTALIVSPTASAEEIAKQMREKATKDIGGGGGAGLSTDKLKAQYLQEYVSGKLDADTPENKKKIAIIQPELLDPDFKASLDLISKSFVVGGYKPEQIFEVAKNMSQAIKMAREATPQQPQFPTITTQEELDKLPSGSYYLYGGKLQQKPSGKK